MRDEWLRPIARSAASTPVTSSPGLTSQSQKKEYQQKTGGGGGGGGGSKTANKPSMGNISLAMASRAMRLKQVGSREVSERRQVGDAEDLVNPTEGATKPWWRNVTMEEGM